MTDEQIDELKDLYQRLHYWEVEKKDIVEALKRLIELQLEHVMTRESIRELV